MPAGRVFRQPRQQYLQWPVLREDATPLGTTDIDTPLDVAAEPGGTHDRQLRGPSTCARRKTYAQYGQRPRRDLPFEDINGTVAVTLGDTTSAASGTHQPGLDAPLDVAGAPGGTHDRALKAPSTDYRRKTYAQYAQHTRHDLPFEQITGTLAVTLDNLTSTASGASGAAGTTARTLADLTATTAGTVGDTGTLAVTLDAVTPTASGTVGDTGTLAQTLADLTSAASGNVGDTGTLSVTLDDTTLAAAGTAGTATVVDEVPTASGVGRIQFPDVPRIRTATTHRATAEADLGTITAHLTAVVEFADEDLILLL